LGSESPTYPPADPLTDPLTDRPELYIQTDVSDLRIDIPFQSSVQCQGNNNNNTDDNMEVVSTDSSICDAYEDRLCELHGALQCAYSAYDYSGFFS